VELNEAWKIKQFGLKLGYTVKKFLSFQIGKLKTGKVTRYMKVLFKKMQKKTKNQANKEGDKSAKKS